MCASRKMPSARPPAQIGLWREGCLLDRADKWVSYYLAFSWQLGLLELPLAVPGTWFGTTTTSLGSAPLLLAAAAEPGNVGLLLAAAGVFLCALVLFCAVLMRRADRGLLWWRPYVAVLCSFGLASALAREQRAAQAASFYIASWGYSVLAGTLVKTVFARKRPCISMPGRDALADARLLPLHEHLCTGYTAIESFPSGDACGGAVASTVLWLVTGGGSWLVWLPMLLSSYGRMYIWAHHLLDVVVGAAIGAGATLALHAVAPWQSFGGAGLALCMGVFVLGRKGVVSLQPPLPPELAGGKHYYG